MELYAYICIYALCSQIRTKLYNTETAWSNEKESNNKRSRSVKLYADFRC